MVISSLKNVRYLCVYFFCFQIQTGYHETITMFYCFVIDDAIKNTKNPAETFDYFLRQNGHLLDRSLMYKYYSKERFSDPSSKSKYVPELNFRFCAPRFSDQTLNGFDLSIFLFLFDCLFTCPFCLLCLLLLA